MGTGGATMNQRTTLAPHEALELHEIIRSEVTAVTKIQASLAMVQDNDMKSFMQTCLQTKQDALRQYQNFYNGISQQQ
jgi:similar to spore coat protein